MELLIIGLLCLFVLDYYLTKNILHPAVVTNAIWLIVSVCFYFGQGELFSLSSDLFVLVFFWNVFFSAGSIFFSKVKIDTNPYQFEFNQSLYNQIYWFVVTATLILIALLIRKAGGFSLSIIIDLRETQLKETNPAINLFYYINSFCLVFFAFSLLNMPKSGYYKIILLAILLFVASILKTNKTSIIQFFFIIGFIMYKQNKINVKSMFTLAFVMALILYAFTLTRDSNSKGELDMAKHISVYLLSPLCAMDMLLTGDQPIYAGAWGSNTFSFVYNVLDFLGISIQRGAYAGWVYVPYPTNVFTVMSTYYADFGYRGVLVSALIFGTFWGIIFKFQQKNSLIAILFYALMVYSIFFQFFADIFFFTFSLTLQYLISALIISWMFKKRMIHYL